MGLETKINMTATVTQAETVDLGTRTANLTKTVQAILASGTAAGQADKTFIDTRSIAPSSNDDLDLAGVLTDPFGGVLTFVRIKAMIVIASAANVNNVIVGGAAATQFLSWVGAAAHTVVLRPGAALALIAGTADATGYVTAAGASDLLRIANGAAGTSVSYDIILVGASA